MLTTLLHAFRGWAIICEARNINICSDELGMFHPFLYAWRGSNGSTLGHEKVPIPCLLIVSKALQKDLGLAVATYLAQTKVALIAPCGVLRDVSFTVTVWVTVRVLAILSHIPCCWNILRPLCRLILVLVVLVVLVLVLVPLLFLILIGVMTVVMMIVFLGRLIGGRCVDMWKV